jgi:hypothetical protein
MADITLTPTTEPVPATTRLVGYQNTTQQSVPEGRRYGVLFVLPQAGKVQEVAALVDEIRALCDESWMTHGVADSIEGKRTEVHVKVQQIPNVELE